MGKFKPSSFGMKGKTHSPETREKMRNAALGRIPWNKGKTGVYSDEIRQIMSSRTKEASKNKENYLGYEDMPGYVMTRVKTNVWARKKRNNRILEVDITSEYIRNLMHSQNFKCKISGVDLKWEICSLDRIDSSSGYIQGNVQWVHKDVNIMKGAQQQTDFINWCKVIAKNNT